MQGVSQDAIALDELSVADAVDAHWCQMDNPTIDEPQIVLLSPETVGLIVPMSSLDEITSKPVLLIHSDENRPASGSSHLYPSYTVSSSSATASII